MFTGIIETTAAIRSAREHGDITTLSIERPQGWELSEGQSIAIDGACLTVVSFDDASFDVELTPETLQRTSFGRNVPGRVNLERAMPADGRFEGHIVQGHVDAAGSVVALERSGEAATLTVRCDAACRPFLVEKGSITIDGVSLTISKLRDDTFSVALIPHTLAVTTLASLQEDDAVNLEFDIIGKYIRRQLETRNK